MTADTGAPETLREAQKRQTKALILRTAAKLFTRQGFNETTISDIAQAVGASRATIYAYFPGKDDIARAIITEVWDGAEGVYAEFGRLTDWSEASVRGWVESAVARWEDNRDLVTMQFAGLVAYDDFHVARHRDFVAAMTANKELWRKFSPDDTERRALMLISGLGSFMNTWLVRGWQMPRDGVIDSIVAVWRGALDAD